MWCLFQKRQSQDEMGFPGNREMLLLLKLYFVISPDWQLIQKNKLGGLNISRDHRKLPYMITKFKGFFKIQEQIVWGSSSAVLEKYLFSSIPSLFINKDYENPQCCFIDDDYFQKESSIAYQFIPY